MKLTMSAMINSLSIFLFMYFVSLAGSDDYTDPVWSPWTACSRSCGGGLRRRSAPCHDCTDNFVHQQLASCNSKKCDQTPKPESHPESSDTPDESAQWSEWSACTKSCGGGLQRRSAPCSHCDDDLGEQQLATCNTQRCGENLKPASKVSKNKNKDNRKTETKSEFEPQPVPLMDKNKVPEITDPVNEGYCYSVNGETDCKTGGEPEWSAWSSCSASCGLGMRSRTKRRSHHDPPEAEQENAACWLALCPDEDLSHYREMSKAIHTNRKTKSNTLIYDEAAKESVKSRYMDPNMEESIMKVDLAKNNGPFKKERALPKQVQSQDGETKDCTVLGEPGEKPVRKVLPNIEGYFDAETGQSVIDRENLEHDLYDDLARYSMPGLESNKYKQQQVKPEKTETVESVKDTLKGKAKRSAFGRSHALWSEWEGWSECSAKCGAGTHTRSRSCQGGQATCQGQQHESKPCEGSATDCAGKIRS